MRLPLCRVSAAMSLLAVMLAGCSGGQPSSPVPLTKRLPIQGTRGAIFVPADWPEAKSEPNTLTVAPKEGKFFIAASGKLKKDSGERDFMSYSGNLVMSLRKQGNGTVGGGEMVDRKYNGLPVRTITMDIKDKDETGKMVLTCFNGGDYYYAVTGVGTGESAEQMKIIAAVAASLKEDP